MDQRVAMCGNHSEKICKCDQIGLNPRLQRDSPYLGYQSNRDVSNDTQLYPFHTTRNFNNNLILGLRILTILSSSPTGPYYGRSTFDSNMFCHIHWLMSRGDVLERMVPPVSLGKMMWLPKVSRPATMDRQGIVKYLTGCVLSI